MEVEIEVGVVDPVVVVEVERHLCQPPPEWRHQRQPLGDQGLQVRARDLAARRGRRVEHGERSDVAEVPGVLEREELLVKGCQLTHDGSSSLCEREPTRRGRL